MNGFWLISYIFLWAFVIVQAILIVVLYRQVGILYLRNRKLEVEEGIDVGVVAPRFQLLDVRGNKVSLADYSNTWVLLIFISPGCGPCRDLMPHINSFTERYASEIVPLILTRSSTQESIEFASMYDIQVPVLIVGESTIDEAYQVSSTPFAFLIDPKGVVRSKGVVNDMSHLEGLLEGTGYPVSIEAV